MLQSSQMVTNSIWTRVNLAILFWLLLSAKVLSRDPQTECQACKDFVITFWKGHENTAKSNFGGGNTDWEETRLGSYATSETRLIEILEHACKDTGDNVQCHKFVEEHEEQIEKWYFHLQKSDRDFEKWLCMKSAKVCCPVNTFGKDCDICPGDPDLPCSGRGECDGNGTTGGTGKCRCQKGYTGISCDSCSSGYDEAEKNSTFILCEDIDECELDPFICNDREYCFNTQGSYKCSKCHKACMGCTGAGTGRCKACAPGYVLTNGTCTAIPRGLYSQFLQLFSSFDKTLVFCGGGLVTSIFFVKNGEFVKLGVVGLLMAVILSAWHYVPVPEEIETNKKSDEAQPGDDSSPSISPNTEEQLLPSGNEHLEL